MEYIAHEPLSGNTKRAALLASAGLANSQLASAKTIRPSPYPTPLGLKAQSFQSMQDKHAAAVTLRNYLQLKKIQPNAPHPRSPALKAIRKTSKTFSKDKRARFWPIQPNGCMMTSRTACASKQEVWTFSGTGQGPQAAKSCSCLGK